MSLTKQAFQGVIVITASSNDRVKWYEDSAFGPYTPEITISAATYHLSDLLDTIVAAMSAASDISGIGQDFAGVGADYAWTMDYSTGIITISGSHPTAAPAMTWYPMITATETRKLLTGGDQTAGTNADPHLGWNVDAAYPSALSNGSFAADEIHSYGWYPSQPKQEDDRGNIHSNKAESVTMGGKVVSYDFSGSTTAYLRRRSMAYRLLSQADRDQFETNFYHHAKQGSPSGRYKYIDNRDSPATYATHVLTEGSLDAADFSRSQPGYPYWSISLTSRVYKP